MNVHHSAAEGFQRGVGAYERARPSYHPAAIGRIVEVAAGRPMVELGAGSGIATQALIEAGATVIAIEPVEAMRSALAARLPDVDVRDGTAEAIPIDDGGAATVVASQSFHWFDHGPALDEIRRVLAPGGALVTLWNVRDESVGWVAEYTAIQAPYEDGTPRHRSGEWRQAIESHPAFDLAEEIRIPNPQPTTAEGVVDRSLSTSFIAALDPDEQARVAARMRELVAPLGEEFDYPYTTEAEIWRAR